MVTDAINPILLKIKKLLALANNDGATEAEAELVEKRT